MVPGARVLDRGVTGLIGSPGAGGRSSPGRIRGKPGRHADRPPSERSRPHQGLDGRRADTSASTRQIPQATFKTPRITATMGRKWTPCPTGNPENPASTARPETSQNTISLFTRPQSNKKRGFPPYSRALRKPPTRHPYRFPENSLHTICLCVVLKQAYPPRPYDARLAAREPESAGQERRAAEAVARATRSGQDEPATKGEIRALQPVIGIHLAIGLATLGGVLAITLSVAATATVPALPGMPVTASVPATVSMLPDPPWKPRPQLMTTPPASSEHLTPTPSADLLESLFVNSPDTEAVTPPSEQASREILPLFPLRPSRPGLPRLSIRGERCDHRRPTRLSLDARTPRAETRDLVNSSRRSCRTAEEEENV